MNEYVLSQENIQEYARKAWEIEKMLSFFEEILPEETNGLYKKYPKLKSILSIIREVKKVPDEKDIQIMENAIDEIANSESIAQIKKELVLWAKELFRIIFPETGTEKFVKFVNSQETLEGYQQVLLAPAKWIERAVWGIVALLKPKTYVELQAWTRFMTWISLENVYSTLKLMKWQFEWLEWSKQASIAIELIVWGCTVIGWIKNAWQILWKFKYLPQIIWIAWQEAHNLEMLIRIFALNKTIIAIR